MIQKESESRDEQGVTQPFYSMDTQLSTSRMFNLIFTFPSSFFIHFLTSLFSLYSLRLEKNPRLFENHSRDNKFGSQINEFISDDRLLISFPALFAKEEAEAEEKLSWPSSCSR